jgi:uncharacterized membrane protein
MTFGPIQMVVLGFGEAALPLDFVNQLRRLRDDGIVRLVDAILVSKDEHGDLNEIRASDITKDEAILLGTLEGALFGYGAGGEEGMELGAEIGMLAAEEGEFGLDSDDIDQIADLIPRGSAAALILLEHLWAIGLKEAVGNANGTVIAHGWITPATLIARGQEFAEEEAMARAYRSPCGTSIDLGPYANVPLPMQ